MPNAGPVGVPTKRKSLRIFICRPDGQTFNQLCYRVRMSQASPCIVGQRPPPEYHPRKEGYRKLGRAVFMTSRRKYFRGAETFGVI